MRDFTTGALLALTVTGILPVLACAGWLWVIDIAPSWVTWFSIIAAYYGIYRLVRRYGI